MKLQSFFATILLFFLASSNLSALTNQDFNDSNQNNFLEVDQAFKVTLGEIKHSQFIVNFDVAKGHYLYKKRIDVKISGPLKISEILFPKSEIKNDTHFGQSEVYHNRFSLPVRLINTEAGSVDSVVQVLYQGCSEKGLCYPPTTKEFKIKIPVITSTTDTIQPQSGSQDKSIALLQGGNFWLIALGFFGFGLLLSLTPCVFPMVPILSGIIVGQGSHSKLDSFKLSLAYVLGMALSYTLAGILAALTGNMISAALQNPWALSLFALIFVVLSLSMFGFYELQLPQALGSNLTHMSNRIKGGKFAGVFLMGALSALIVSPCVAAPLAGALIYIGQTHNVLIGAVALFLLSLGMGVPLLLIGASAGALLPKAGPWMDGVKNFFGVIMLGVAIWIISPLIPQFVKLFLVAILLIGPSIYLGALEPLRDLSPKWGVIKKGVGVLLLAIGLFLLFTSFNESGIAPNKASIQNASQSEIKGLGFKRIKNIDALNDEIKNSKNNLVMLDFYADWCVACKEFEEGPFKDPLIKRDLEGFTLLQADVTANSSEDKALMNKFHLFGPPGIIFINKQGDVVYKVIGYQNREAFHSSINKAISLSK